MRCSLRSIVIMTAAIVVTGGCTTKPPPSEPEPKPVAQPAPARAVAPGTTAAAGPLSGSGSAASAVGSASIGSASAEGNGSSGSGAGSAAPPKQAQTAQERRAELDKQLNDSLGSFDAGLRKEQQKIAVERDARQATVTASASASAKSGADQTADAAGTTATEVPEKSSWPRGSGAGKRGDTRAAQGGDLKSDKSPGGANGSVNGNGALANEVPDGNDDDIVARRLRKAAEQETDPELKDQLWKEYVVYKKNVQVN
jgi:hypothetical protein